MDMDGTLLDSSNTIQPKTKQFLMELQRQGITLILASGRSYTRLMEYAKELDMKQYGGYLIEVDGVAIYDLKNEKRHVLKTFHAKDMKDVYAYIMHKECEVQAVFDDGLYAYIPKSIMELKKRIRKQENYPENFPWTAGPWGWLADMTKGYPHIRYIQSEQELDRDFNKIQCMHEEDRIKEVYKDLMQDYSDQFEIFRTCPRQLEVLPKGISKGKTLERLMNEKGWSKEDVIAFGDGENDVSLFEYVEISYAMGQAALYVKEKAKYVTDTNNEEGIYKALRKELG